MTNECSEFLIITEELEADDIAIGMLMDSSSEEENGQINSARKGKSPNKERDFVGAYASVIKNYFNGIESVYSEADFERRFRCPRPVFDRIQEALEGTDPFIQKKDALGKMGIHPLVKLVGCFRYLTYGDALDREDENLYIAESTLDGYVKKFTKLVKAKFGSHYLNRPPTSMERKAISTAMKGKGFPGCLGSWDCKHFNWKNCPMRLAGQHQGHAEGGKKTLILEAISDHRKYIWYANFGDPGSLNDINVLDRSSIVGSLLSGDIGITTAPYTINGNRRDWMYFLVDGIYPDWAIFVSTFSTTTDPKKLKFSAAQERVRKDIECAFGIIVQQFHVLQRPLRNWYLEDIIDLLHCCVIIHNMIVEFRHGDLGYDEEAIEGKKFPLFGCNEITPGLASLQGVDLFAARVAAFDDAMTSSFEHYKLKGDLLEHINST